MCVRACVSIDTSEVTLSAHAHVRTTVHSIAYLARLQSRGRLLARYD